MLRFAVDATVDGTKLDQTSIASAFYGKNGDFDCSTDPLVRVQFSRLRGRLNQYYATEGASDAFRILISPRGYNVSVETYHGSTEGSQDAPIERPGPMVLNDR